MVRSGIEVGGAKAVAKKVTIERKPWAQFSNCEEHASECQKPSCVGRKYRYLLAWPTGLDNGRIALGVFANPSTADAEKLDPTLKRWLNYCRDWGYGWSWTCNVRAWRATDPKDVPLNDGRACGQLNFSRVLDAARGVALVVCGWGKLGGQLGDALRWELQRCNIPLHALRFNQDGSPAHPLYLPRNLKPIPFGRTGLIG